MPQFTKNAISDAFFRIAAQKPPEKITVKDIVEECGVTRNTFYYYFRDVYDVIEDAFLTIAAGIEHAGPEERLENTLTGFADFLYRNRAAMRRICDSIGSDTVASYLSRAVDQTIRSVVKTAAAGMEVQETDIRLITSFFRESLLGLLLGWLQSDAQSHPLDLLKRVAELDEGVLPLLLSNAEKNPRPPS